MPLLSLREDRELLERIRAGDEEAFKTVYTKSFPVVKNYILSNSGSEQDFKDIFHEAMLIFHENVRSGRLQLLTSKISTYVRGIARKKWLGHLRKDNKVAHLGVSADIADQTEEPKEPLEQHLKKILEKLGDPCRGILIDFYCHHLSMRDIAHKYDMNNEETAKKRKYKCLKRAQRYAAGIRTF